MRLLLLVVVAGSSLIACSGRGEDRSGPAPATVRIDSTGVVVDTTAQQ